MIYDRIRYRAYRVLFDGGTLAEAARAAGVSPATVLRWKQERLDEEAARRARAMLALHSAGWNPRAGRRDPKKRRDVP